MRRGLVAVGILLAWVAGMGMLVRREYFRPAVERLAAAALRVTPDAVFYAVMRGDQQIGFASSTLDTTSTTIELRDFLVADIPSDGGSTRAEIRTNVILSRTFRLQSFEHLMESGNAVSVRRGTVIGDSVMQLTLERDGVAADTQQVPITGPLLMPSLVPLAIALEDRPNVGQRHGFPVFDTTTASTRNVRLDVRAESLFVVNDSSVFDEASGLWVGALPDTIRAWQIVPEQGPAPRGWVDEQGRLVVTTQPGLRYERRPYEVAFENWRRRGDTAAARREPTRTLDADIVAATLLESRRRPDSGLAELRVRVGGPALERFALDGGRQDLRGDTVVIGRESDDALAPRYTPVPPGRAREMNPDLQAAQFLEVDHPEIIALASRIAGRDRDTRAVAERLLRWVHDSVTKEPTVGIPSALHVLHTRRGDANEHAQLYVALARAAGLPSRLATGLVYADGRFYYHAWPEVMLRGWVAVDPTLGYFPAGASHLRLMTGATGRQSELMRLLSGTTLDVVSSR